MDRGGPHLYTGSKYRDIRRSLWKIQGGGCNNHPSEDVLQKIPQEDEGLFYVTRMSSLPHSQGILLVILAQVLIFFPNNWPKSTKSLFTIYALIVCGTKLNSQRTTD